MRICSNQPCIVLLTEKDVWLRVNGKEPISLKANHITLLSCENNIIDVSSLNNTLVAYISLDIIKDYLRFLNKDLSKIPVWQRSCHAFYFPVMPDTRGVSRRSATQHNAR